MESTIEAVAELAIRHYDSQKPEESSAHSTGILYMAIATALKQSIDSDARAYELWWEIRTPLIFDECGAHGASWMDTIVHNRLITDAIAREVFRLRPDIEEKTRFWRQATADLC